MSRAEDDADLRARLCDRLAEIDQQLSELWLSGLSVGGGVAFDDRRWELQEEARTLKARIAELGG